MKRTFVHTGGAWYGKSALKDRRYVDDVIIQICDDDGNMQHEMVVEFHDLKMTTGLSARVCCFDADTSVLLACTDVLEALRESQAWSPNNFTKLLIRLGFEDLTPLSANPVNEDSMREMRSLVRPMVEDISGRVEWDQIDGELVNIGLFFNNGQLFVAPIGVGLPDTNGHLMGGATFINFSTIKQTDDASDLTETCDALIYGEESRIISLLTPNEAVTT